MIEYIKILADINADKLPKPGIQSALPGILRVVFAAAALLSVIFVAIGGLKYVLSNGDPQGMAKAKNTIINALVGLIIAVSAFTIISFVGTRLL